MMTKTNLIELTDLELAMLDEIAFYGAGELNYLFSKNQKNIVKKVMGKIEYALYLKMERKGKRGDSHLDELLQKIKGIE